MKHMPGCNELFLHVDLCCFDENNHFITEIDAGSTEKFLVIRFSVYKNDAARRHQLQHLSEPSIFMLDVSRTADHAGQILIPHRPSAADNVLGPPPSNFIDGCVAPLIICLQRSIAN